MIKNRTAQLVFLSAACTVGVIGFVASLGLFDYAFRWDFYTHFTNISNYFCLGVLLAELVATIRKKEDSFVSTLPRLKFFGVLAILLTFCVFNFMLAPAREAYLNFTVSSISLHVIMPVLFIADWFLFYERGNTKLSYPISSILFPLAYGIYVFAHAAIRGFDSSILNYLGTGPLIYPYFFLNVDELGVGGVAKWMAILAVAFMAVGFVFYGLDHLLRAKKSR